MRSETFSTAQGKHTFVKPGRSTSVRSRTLGLYILKLMGSLLIPLFCPATRNVSASISFRISAKSVNLLSVWRNWAYSGNGGCGASSGGKGVCINWSTSGLRVTIPCPRGRKSRPTMLKKEMSFVIRRQQVGEATYFSRTLDLPADWLPTWHSAISDNSKHLVPVNTYNSKLRHVQLASWAGHTVNTPRSKGRAKRLPTEVAERVLKLVDEFNKVNVHLGLFYQRYTDGLWSSLGLNLFYLSADSHRHRVAVAVYRRKPSGR